MSALGAGEKVSVATPSRGYAALLYVALSMLFLVSTYLASLHSVHNATIFDGMYGFGVLTRNIVQQHQWGLVDEPYGFWCYACRMPVIPALQAAGASFSSRMITF